MGSLFSGIIGFVVGFLVAMIIVVLALEEEIRKDGED